MRNERRPKRIGRRTTAVAALIGSLTLAVSSAEAHSTPGGVRGLPSNSTAHEQLARGDGFEMGDAGILAGSAVVFGLGLAVASTRLRPKRPVHS
jgi:hypothetical protein